MNDDSQAPSLYPYFGYRDPAAAIEWLERAFGFETTLRWDGEDGQPLHAELRCGNGAIMLGRSPAHEGAPESGSDHGVYVLVDDVDAHFARSSAAGARIVFPPEDTDWGTRRYRVLDLEGYEWSFGTYRPGQEPS